jgi:anti-sigma regulatory factor (Ser/Thr protein kinase)
MDNTPDIEIIFPSDADYITGVRKFLAEATLIEGFSQKFSYRSEIIIDELCNNATKFGPIGKGAKIKLDCHFSEDSIDLNVRDGGGDQRDVTNLKSAISAIQGERRFMGRGLEIVKMLSSSVEMVEDGSGETVVRVIKQRSQNIIDTLTE